MLEGEGDAFGHFEHTAQMFQSKENALGQQT
jgi:hypothetical protein